MRIPSLGKEYITDKTFFIDVTKTVTMEGLRERQKEWKIQKGRKESLKKIFLKKQINKIHNKKLRIKRQKSILGTVNQTDNPLEKLITQKGINC